MRPQNAETIQILEYEGSRHVIVGVTMPATCVDYGSLTEVAWQACGVCGVMHVSEGDDPNGFSGHPCSPPRVTPPGAQLFVVG